MVRSVAERYTVAAFAFVAAATWLGVGVVHGLLCLFVAALAAQATRFQQRRRDARSRASARRRARARRPPAAHRPQRSRPYDTGAEIVDWAAVGDGAR